MVHALDLAQLNGVHHHADVTVAGEPRAPVLVADLVAVAHPVGLNHGMAANVEDGGRGCGKFLWHIHVGGDIEAGPGLEMQFLHREVGMVKRAGDRGLQIRLRRQRVQPQHFEELLAGGHLVLVPVLDCAHLSQRTLGQRAGLGTEILGEHPVPGRGVGRELAVAVAVGGRGGLGVMQPGVGGNEQEKDFCFHGTHQRCHNQPGRQAWKKAAPDETQPQKIKISSLPSHRKRAQNR